MEQERVSKLLSSSTKVKKKKKKSTKKSLLDMRNRRSLLTLENLQIILGVRFQGI